MKEPNNKIILDKEINEILSKKNNKKNNLINDLIKIANKLKHQENLKEKCEEIKKRNKNVKLFKCLEKII